MIFKAWKIILFKWIFKRNKGKKVIKRNNIIFEVRDKYNKLEGVYSNGKR